MNASIGKVLRAIAVLVLAVASSSVTLGTAVVPGIYPNSVVI